MKQFNPKIEPSFHDKNQKYDISLEFVRDLIGYDALNMVHDALIQAGYKEMLDVVKAVGELNKVLSPDEKLFKVRFFGKSAIQIETELNAEIQECLTKILEAYKVLNEKHGTEVVE